MNQRIVWKGENTDTNLVSCMSFLGNMKVEFVIRVDEQNSVLDVNTDTCLSCCNCCQNDTQILCWDHFYHSRTRRAGFWLNCFFLCKYLLALTFATSFYL